MIDKGATELANTPPRSTSQRARWIDRGPRASDIIRASGRSSATTGRTYDCSHQLDKRKNRLPRGRPHMLRLRLAMTVAATPELFRCCARNDGVRPSRALQAKSPPPPRRRFWSRRSAAARRRARRIGFEPVAAVKGSEHLARAVDRQRADFDDLVDFAGPHHRRVEPVEMVRRHDEFEAVRRLHAVHGIQDFMQRRALRGAFVARGAALRLAIEAARDRVDVLDHEKIVSRR